MAVTVTSPSFTGSGWKKNATSADASNCEEIIAAPAAGTAHYIEHIVISSDAAISVTIGAGEAANNVEAALMGPITFAAGQCMSFPMVGRSKAMKLPAAKSLTFDASGAGNVCVFVQGYTA